MPRYFFYIQDLKKGHADCGVPEYGYPDDPDIVWITASNSFAAEATALEAYQEGRIVKNGKGYKLSTKKVNKNKGSKQVDGFGKDAILKL
jgi:hypothetical protein